MVGGGAGEPLRRAWGYHPECPGCRVDRRKEEREGIPYTELSLIWLVTVSSSECSSASRRLSSLTLIDL
jgi:hypothetical protein